MNVAIQMPKYKCHKEVWALQIAEIQLDDDSAIIVPTEEGYGAFRVDYEYMRKHNPYVGGYYVVYKDGYKSFSPADAFESGYTKING